MSKIGRIALEAQEEVLNPLGYSTIEEAIADGWDSAEWMAARESEQEQAHEAWLGEKSACLAGLVEASAYASRSDDYFAIKRAIEFVKGVKHE